MTGGENTSLQQVKLHFIIKYAYICIYLQMDAALRKAEERISGKKLKESDYLDVLETVCGVKTWEKYVMFV